MLPRLPAIGMVEAAARSQLVTGGFGIAIADSSEKKAPCCGWASQPCAPLGYI
jgi:hypothetical protein